MAVSVEHIEITDTGAPKIIGTRCKVLHIVYEIMNGLTPAGIHEQYPHLSMAQIHAALAYYYDHKEELDARTERELQTVAELRKNSKQLSREELLRRL